MKVSALEAASPEKLEAKSENSSKLLIGLPEGNSISDSERVFQKLLKPMGANSSPWVSVLASKS